MFLFALMFATGCSDQPKDTWYQDTVGDNASRDEYIRSQVEQGVDPTEAKNQYNMKQITIQTEGRSAE